MPQVCAITSAEQGFGRRTVRHQPALLQHQHPVGMVHRLRQIMEHQHHPPACPRLIAERADQGGGMGKIKIGQRLVRQQPARLARQHPRHQRPRALAAREARDRPGAQVRQVHRGERPGNHRVASIRPRQPAERHQHFNGDIPGHFGRLRQEADSLGTVALAACTKRLRRPASPRPIAARAVRQGRRAGSISPHHWGRRSR